MITIPKFLDRSSEPVVRLIGIGNAGVNLADRITMAGMQGVGVVAMNSDLQSLSSSVAAQKVALGPLATRGLGAGGDPEIGSDAARESAADIEEAVSGADIVFLCGGLGGGTASGAAGIVAEAAKQAGALLIAVVTTPFAFEGRRRTSQAAAAIQEIEAQADAVIHFENDRMAELSAPRAGVSETFAACDDVLTGCVFSLVRLLATPGPLAVGLPDLLAVLRGGNEASLFGTGSSSGDNRAHEALEQALRSPLLDRGRLLDDAASLLVHVSGPADLSFAEATVILSEISKHTSDSAQIHLGVSTVPQSGIPVVVTLLGKCGSAPAQPARERQVTPARRSVTPPPKPVRTPEPEASVQSDFSEPGIGTPSPEEAETAAPTPIQPIAPARAPRPAPEPTKPKPTSPKVRQETLQFEPVARGRFEKIEPTIVEGEDLDVPTFLRQNNKRR